MILSALHRGRFLVGLLLIAVCGALLAGLGPASASSIQAKLLIRGPGYTYTSAPPSALTGLPADPGGKSTYYLRIVNTGTSLEQFRLKTSPRPIFGIDTYTVLNGTHDVTALTKSTVGYTTPTIAPGKYITLKLVQYLPLDVNDGSHFVDLDLRSTDDIQIARGIVDTQSVRSKGTTATGMFVRAGYGDLTGGLNPRAYSAPFTMGRAVPFTMRLKNDSDTPSTVRLDANATLNSLACDATADLSYTVKDGFKDVTATVDAGTYTSPTITPGHYRDLKVSITITGTDPGGSCKFPAVNVNRFDAASVFQGATSLIAVGP